MESIEPLKEPKRALEYVDEFKEIIREHPGIMRTFKSLEKQADKSLMENGQWEQSFEEDGVTIKLLDSLGKYVKADIEGNSYFIKREKGHYSKTIPSYGADEFRSTNLLKKMVENEPDVETVDFQLGYQDDEGTTYFISKWVYAPRMREYLLQLSAASEEGDEEARKLREALVKRVSTLDTFLKEQGFVDISENNMFYEPETGKIMLFDAHFYSQD